MELMKKHMRCTINYSLQEEPRSKIVNNYIKKTEKLLEVCLSKKYVRTSRAKFILTDKYNKNSLT